MSVLRVIWIVAAVGWFLAAGVCLGAGVTSSGLIFAALGVTYLALAVVFGE